MESMLSHGKGAAFFSNTSQGVLGPYQQLDITLTGCANMWGEYWDSLICTVRLPWASHTFRPLPEARTHAYAHTYTRMPGLQVGVAVCYHRGV